MTLADICAKACAGERLSPEEGLDLLAHAELLDLGGTANEIRFRKNPETRVTFHVDTNPNYTNVCNVDCIFCAFYRHPGEEGAYTHSVDTMIGKFRESAANGVTTILLGMARVAGLTVPDVLRRLWEAGLRTIPGGGAEILSDRVKQKISHLKGSSDDWLGVMREAHRLGFRTTATMMYGHLETDSEIIMHLDRVRDLQDEYRGFTAFIPWSFKPGNTPLEKIIPHYATPVRYLQMIALSRIYLDNFPHIQASWFSEGKKTGQIALHFGADDFGGTLQEENVHAAARFVNTTSTEECIQMIHDAGFAAAQRNTVYDILRTYEVPSAAA